MQTYGGIDQYAFHKLFLSWQEFFRIRLHFSLKNDMVYMHSHIERSKYGICSPAQPEINGTFRPMFTLKHELADEM